MQKTRRWLVMTAMFLVGCGGRGAPALFTDPASDADPPPELRSITIPSHGESLLARVLVAPGPGPHPLVLLLHGFPGNENNFDLAHALRRTGWNVAIVHYRGSWGSPGRFTFTHVLEDVDAAIDHLRSPEVAEGLRSDRERVVLVGHSMGGFAALWAAAHRDDVAGAASLAGFNFGASAERVRADAEERAAITGAFGESLAPLNAPSAEALVEEYVAAGDDWDLRSHAEALRDVPVLLLAGSRDEVAPAILHHVPLRDTLRDLGHAHLTAMMLPDGHGFGSSRIALSRLLWRWLEPLRDGGTSAAPEDPSPGPDGFRTREERGTG